MGPSPRSVIRPGRVACVSILVAILILAPVAGAVSTVEPPAATDSSAGSAVAEQHDVGGPSLTIQQERPGNVFHPDQNPRVTVKTDAERIEWIVHDYHGAPVSSDETAVEGGSVTVEFPTEPGYYTVDVTATADGSRADARATIAVVEPHSLNDYPSEDSFFYVDTAFPRLSNPEVLVPLMNETGMGHVGDYPGWDNVERMPGQYEFSKGWSGAMEHLVAHDLDPFYAIAFSNPIHVECAESTSKCAPHTPAQRQAYANYAEWMVADQPYAEQVFGVEIWNEYNIHFSTGPAGQDPVAYAELAKAAYPQIKDRRPDVSVVVGSAAFRPLIQEDQISGFEWTRRVLEAGGAEAGDAVGVHPYRRQWSPEDPEAKYGIGNLKEEMDALQAMSANYTDDGEPMPIWNTEFGYRATGETGVGNRTQAQYLVRSHAMTKAAGVEKLNWYRFKARMPQHGRGGNGLVRARGHPYGRYAPRPAYSAYSTMTRQLTGFEPIGGDSANELADIDAYGYEFTDGETTKHTLWVEEGTRDVTVETDDALSVTTITGEHRTLEPVDGEIYLTLSEDPLYVTGEIGAVREGTPVSVSAEDAILDQPIRTTLAYEGNSAGALPDSVTATTDGVETTIERGADANIEAPAAPTTGNRTIRTQLRADGELVGLLRAETVVRDRFDSSARVSVTDDGAQSASLTLSNNARTASTLRGVEWNVSGQTGSTSLDRSVPAGGSVDVSIDIEGLKPWSTHDARATFTVDDGRRVALNDQVMVNPIPRRTVEVDGDFEEHQGLTAIDLNTQATVEREPDFHDGPADLGGTVWFAYDDEHLYMAADITDDNMTSRHPPADVWKSDSIQLGLSTDPPGSRETYYAFNIGRTTEGDVVFRGSSLGDAEEGIVLEEAEIAMERDDDAGRTTYEVAIPWSSLEPLSASNRTVSLSFLVNDNDGEGRKEYITWASGIGSGKHTQLYRPARLVASTDEDRESTTSSPGTEEPAQTVEQSSPDPETGATSTDADDPEPAATESPADGGSTETGSSGPGFGVLVGALSMLVVAFWRRERE